MATTLIALGLATGYLINKRASISEVIDTQVAEYDNAAKPEDTGASTGEIKQAHKRLDDVRFGDFNESFTLSERDGIVRAAQDARMQVAEYEHSNSQLRIEGVHLTTFAS